MVDFADDEYDFLFKLVIIGDSGVGSSFTIQFTQLIIQNKKGKTQLLNRFIQDKFNTDSKSTIGVEFGSKKVTTADKKIVKIQIWDTAGQEKYKAISKVYYQGALGALLVFDITNQKSLEKASQWLQELKDNAQATIQILLVGNKNDLENERQVQQENAKEFAELNNLAYIETSAKTADNVEIAFGILIEFNEEFVVSPTPQEPTTEKTEKTSLPKPQDNIVLTPQNQQKVVEKKKKKNCC